MLVNYAINSPTISVARQNRPSPDEDLDIDHHLPSPDDEPLDEWRGMTQVTAAAVFIIVLGVVLASDLTSPTGSAPIGTTLFIGAVGGLIWATFFFILAYIPLALIALVRARRR